MPKPNMHLLLQAKAKIHHQMKLQHQMKQANIDNLHAKFHPIQYTNSTQMKLQMQAKAKMLHQIAVPKQEAQARQVHNIPVDFILFTDTTLTNNMHHPNTMLVVLKADEQSSATPPLCRNPIFTVSCKQHTQIIHINLTHLLSNP